MEKIVVIGGGYAGLSCLIALAKSKKALQLHLVDRNNAHAKVTNLHKCLERSVGDYLVPYQGLARRYGFTFHHQSLVFSEEILRQWSRDKQIDLDGELIPFDHLVVTSGSKPLKNIVEGAFGLEQLWRGEGPALLSRIETLGQDRLSDPIRIGLVGGGATGLQVLFELQHKLQKKGVRFDLQLIDLATTLLPDMNAGAHRYVVRKLRREGISYRPQTRLTGWHSGLIQLEQMDTLERIEEPLDLLLNFTGIRRAPFDMQANDKGQMVLDGEVLESVFVAGDCSDYAGRGLNDPTAQAALRKGRHVAANILRMQSGRSLQPYRYSSRGYLVSLGHMDAIGWVGLRCNLSKGVMANILKEGLETQWDLFLDGIDSYL